MIVHDFRCVDGHVSEHYVRVGDTSVQCPKCQRPALCVYLKPPKLDWSGMAQGESAGPEFIDRWARVHKEETEKQEKILKEHGDYGPGYAPPPSLD